MLQTQTVTSKLLELLKALMKIEELKGLRLVGGTNLALQIGHRHSHDIDLFGKHDIDDYSLSLLMGQFESVQLLSSSKSIKIFKINDVKVDIVNYPYPWLKGITESEGIRLAQKEDIAAMKLAAITQRGSKKDFIDLFFLLQEFSIQKIFDFYKQKISDGSQWRAMKSLTYFDDADKQPMPIMYKEFSWELIKKQIIKTVFKFQHTL